MKSKVKVTVIDNKLCPDSAKEYCGYPNLGRCSRYHIGDEFIFERDGTSDRFGPQGQGTLVKTTADPDTVSGGPKKPHCGVAWDEVLARYVYAGLKYTGLRGETIVKGWRKNEEKTAACCRHGARSVVFKIERIDPDDADGAWVKTWPADFVNWAGSAFEGCGNGQRLLGNLLVLSRYANTLGQGLAGKGKELLLNLQRATALLWDFLDGNIAPMEFTDFAALLYDCCYIQSTEEWDELDELWEELGEVPELFQEVYIGDDRPYACEWMAVEWAARLLLQLVSIAGGRLDFDEFENCEHVDFYGVYLMLEHLEYIAGAGEMPSFQEIARTVREDLQRAQGAAPEEFALLREEYRSYTIVPEKYAQNLQKY